MPKIFISYRRADSRKDAGRIYDRFVEAFGKENIFKDVDSIPLGKDFRGVLREAVAQCDILFAIIGKQWLTVTDEKGQRRLDNAGDFVRIEIESALQRDSCLVIPVLVDNAPMPRADDLPLDLRELAFKNATVVRDDPDFHPDVTRIIRELERTYGKGAASTPHPAPRQDVHDQISAFFRAFDEQHWETARALLTDIRSSGKAPRVFDVDAHEREVWLAIEAQEREAEYNILRLMAQRPNHAHLWESLQVFWQSYPDYDPDNLVRFKPAPPKPRRRSSVDILPAPFAWIEIPAGKVTLITEDSWADNYIPKGKKGTTFDIPTFAIAKYPVTNAQFALFIEAGGYQQSRWWTETGWEARAQGWAWTGSEWKATGTAWVEPRYWQDSKWNLANHPVVGVSWYEAVAYCQWLSETTGERIMLPTEQQWQRAAQGDDGRIYPWSKDWDCQRCNNSVKPCDSNQTTPVTAYEGKPKGDSPFGVVDMAGNVWEWCSTAYESGSEDLNRTDVRLLRGGSWVNFDSYVFRVGYRNWYDPHDWSDFRGFRLARSLK